MSRELSERLTVRSTSPADSEQLGFVLGSRLDEGLCICLTGALGSGKTIVARGICRGIGVSESVLSPSFILFEEYEGRRRVVHCDLYRLQHEDDLEALGLFDRIGGGDVVLVEWGDRSPRLMAQADVTVHLVSGGLDERRIDIAYRPRLRQLMEGLAR
jgi:tRNA threonylcarbamoyladenosine biosynthesis protein TsaE